MIPGFADPVLDAQASFRAALDAMARPGRIQRIAAPAEPPPGLGRAAAALLLTLADADTPVWLEDMAAADWARFHAGCPLVAAPEDAAFVFAAEAPPALAGLAQGSEEEPHRSATLVLEVAGLEAAAGWRLTGPGIEHSHALRVAGAPADLPAQLAANRAHFPRGVDLVLTCGDLLAALPRTTRVEAG
jgi:alpha-D-ribose 1-methylphosphonate 5-triphosphate synthase subunit PhnH